MLILKDFKIDLYLLLNKKTVICPKKVLSKDIDEYVMYYIYVFKSRSFFI